MNVKEIIQNYTNAIQLINEYFDRKGNFPPEDMTDVWWSYEGNSLQFEYDEPTDNDHDFNYSLEIVHNNIVIKDDYTWVMQDDGCGNRFPVILDNAKRLDY